MIEIPIHRRGDEVRAWTTVSDEDADLADRRWFMGNGYARCAGGRRGVQFSMHTIILERMGHKPGSYEKGDHIDRNPLNNQRNNLRPATSKLNAENRDQSRITGRPRVLPDALPRVCEREGCGVIFTPIRKKPNQRFCGNPCARMVTLAYNNSEIQSQRSLKRWEQEKGFRNVE